MVEFILGMITGIALICLIGYSQISSVIKHDVKVCVEAGADEGKSYKGFVESFK